MNDDIEPETQDYETSEHSAVAIERIAAQVAFGRRIFTLANDPNESLGFVLDKARDGFAQGLDNFLLLDMSQPDAFQRAIGFQSDMKRYATLVQWVDEAVTIGKQAEAELKGLRRVANQPGEVQLTEEQKDYYGAERTDD